MYATRNGAQPYAQSFGGFPCCDYLFFHDFLLCEVARNCAAFTFVLNLSAFVRFLSTPTQAKRGIA
jgi:hypothetical protein